MIVKVDTSDLEVANDQLLLSFNWDDSSDEPDVEDIVSVTGDDAEVTLSFTVSDSMLFSIPISKDKKKVIVFEL